MKTPINRRSILRAMGLAPLAALPVAATAFAPDQLTEPENPRLLELGEKLTPFVAAMSKRHDHMKSVFKAAMAEWPDAPEQLISNPPKGCRGLHDYERDVAGGARQYDNHNHVRSADNIHSDIESSKRDLKRKVILKNPKRVKRYKDHIRDARKDLKLAVAYQSECNRIKIASGYVEASAAYYAAKDTLHTHITAIMGEPETSMAGVAVKAQALDGWRGVDGFSRRCNIGGAEWAEEMSAAVMRRVVVSGAV